MNDLETNTCVKHQNIVRTCQMFELVCGVCEVGVREVGVCEVGVCEVGVCEVSVCKVGVCM
eukprot:Awhi_evm1s9450